VATFRYKLGTVEKWYLEIVDWKEVRVAERVGFVLVEPAPINKLGAIEGARTSQIHSNPEYEVQNRYSATVFRSSRILSVDDR
jgi:hypothetical protein